MSDSESPAQLVLDALGYALFLRRENGSLQAVGQSPKWLRQLWPALEAAAAELPVAEASPFGNAQKAFGGSGAALGSKRVEIQW